MPNEPDLHQIRAWVKEIINSLRGYPRSTRLRVYAHIHRYWEKRKAEKASLRDVAYELGMEHHTMLFRWMRTYEKHLRRTTGWKRPVVQGARQAVQTPSKPRIRVRLPNGTEFEADDPAQIPAIIHQLSQGQTG